MLNLITKRLLDKGLESLDQKLEIFYYGWDHLRLIQDNAIVLVIPLETSTIDDIRQYFDSHGFKLGGEIEISTDIKPLKNLRNKINGSWW